MRHLYACPFGTEQSALERREVNRLKTKAPSEIDPGTRFARVPFAAATVKGSALRFDERARSALP
jgi:hypothetical protein